MAWSQSDMMLGIAEIAFYCESNKLLVRVPVIGRILLICLALGGMSSSALSLPLDNFVEEFEKTIEPFWEKTKVPGTISPEPGIELQYYYLPHPEPQATLVIMSGWTEVAEKYREIFYDFHQYGLEIFFMDWRGQGRSTRELEDPQKSYITNYEVYVEDFDLFMEKVVIPRQTKRPIYAFAHSMGANIASMYLATKDSPFEKVILSSPMLDIRTFPWPEFFVYGVSWIMNRIGFAKSYVLTHGPYEGVRYNNVTTADIRNKHYYDYRTKHQEVLVFGATWSWMEASIKATWIMREKAPQIKVPILMLQAENDLLVETEGQDYVCENAQDCRKIFYPGAMHEILNEVDPIREKGFVDITSFLNLSKVKVSSEGSDGP